MNIQELHQPGKEVSAIPLFKTEQGTVTVIQILKKQQLKEHITKTNALLICVTGETIFENEKGSKINLTPGDYVIIEPGVKHWLEGELDNQLLLIK